MEEDKKVTKRFLFELQNKIQLFYDCRTIGERRNYYLCLSIVNLMIIDFGGDLFGIYG